MQQSLNSNAVERLSALRPVAWHAGGQRFESAWLHFLNPGLTWVFLFLAQHVIVPTFTPTGQVGALRHKGPMQRTGENRHPIGGSMMAEEATGHADLGALTAAQHRMLQQWPDLNRCHQCCTRTT